MSFINHDIYSIYLLLIILILSTAFNTNRKQITSLLSIPFNSKENYAFLYFQRNTNFSFLRFLNFILTTLITNSFVALLYTDLSINKFVILLVNVFCFFIIQHIMILIFGLSINKYAKYMKISIINIDIKTFISIYFFPILLIISYSNFMSHNLNVIISILFLIFLIIMKLWFVIKSNNYIGLKFIHIISYICILEFIPIIAFYFILK